MDADAAEIVLTQGREGLNRCVMRAMLLVRWLKGIEKIITKRIDRHLIRQAMSDLIETNDRSRLGAASQVIEFRPAAKENSDE